MAKDTDRVLSLREDNFWLAVIVPECIVIFIINAFTLITFARNRHLRKRSTYLIINLTVADLLVGVVTGPLSTFASDIVQRNLKFEECFSWQAFIVLVFNFLSVVASLVIIPLISLDRLHATIYPFRHCLIREWFYFKIIVCSWLIALLMAFVLVYLHLCARVAFPFALASCIFLALLILTVSYVMIISNVKNNPHSQNVGSLFSAERKLTVTLFIVTVISYLTILPWAIGATIHTDMWRKLSSSITLRFTYVLYFANSIVNPLIYAIRMEEFREAAKELICKRTPESMRVQPIELPTV